MEHWRSDLENKSPRWPQAGKKIHGEYCLGNCPSESSDACKSEEFAEEFVGGRVYAVEDDRDMRKKFGDNVEGTCTSALLATRDH